MFEIVKSENENIVTINSREVAEMMEMQHSHLLEKIDNMNKIFGNREIDHQIYWEESTFGNRGKQYRCFDITKKGCEMLAHKSTGEKGVIFTHRYMQKFEEMEKILKKEIENPFMGLSKELQAIFTIDQKQQEMSLQIEKVKNDFQTYKEESPLFNIECEEISRAVRRKGVEVLGGKNAKAYADKSVRSKVYTDIYCQLKRNFDVNSYKAINRKFYFKALELIKEYKAPVTLSEDIQLLNGLEGRYTVNDWINS